MDGIIEKHTNLKFFLNNFKNKIFNLYLNIFSMDLTMFQVGIKFFIKFILLI